MNKFFMIPVAIFSVSVINAQMFTTFSSPKHPGLSGWKLGELMHFEDFDDLSDWSYEGNITASANGILMIQTGMSDSDRGNVWSKKEFTGPYYFEWKFKDLNDGLNLVFWGARTCDGTDFFVHEY